MTIHEIPIKDCVHYRGFRYGGFGNNIYEDYLISINSGEDKSFVQEEFIEKLLAYNGSDFGSSLGISLRRKYEPWVFPWTCSSFRFGYSARYSLFDPLKNPDIVCHFSKEGILASHINREFIWLENALLNMSKGYDPDSYGFITVRKLVKASSFRYLVYDGNHRISALHALGYKTVVAKIISPSLHNRLLYLIWPGIICGYYLAEDALTIFDRYFYDYNQAIDLDLRQKIIFDEPIMKTKKFI